MWQRADISDGKKDQLFAVLDTKRKIDGMAGKVVSTHKNMNEAHRKAKNHPHTRAVELRVQLKPGDWANGLTEVVQSQTARWS